MLNWSPSRLRASPSALGLGRKPNGGYLRRNSDAQVNEAGDQYSGR